MNSQENEKKVSNESSRARNNFRGQRKPYRSSGGANNGQRRRKANQPTTTPYCLKIAKLPLHFQELDVDTFLLMFNISAVSLKRIGIDWIVYFSTSEQASNALRILEGKRVNEVSIIVDYIISEKNENESKQKQQKTQNQQKQKQNQNQTQQKQSTDTQESRPPCKIVRAKQQTEYILTFHNLPLETSTGDLEDVLKEYQPLRLDVSNQTSADGNTTVGFAVYGDGEVAQKALEYSKGILLNDIELIVTLEEQIRTNSKTDEKETKKETEETKEDKDKEKETVVEKKEKEYDSRKLFLKGFPESTTKGMLAKIFEEYHPTDVTLAKNFCFLLFANEEDCKKALSCDVVAIFGSNAVLKQAFKM